MAFARANLSHVKSPRRIDFMAELPRHPTGKLYKRLIRDAYWGKGESRIVLGRLFESYTHILDLRITRLA